MAKNDLLDKLIGNAFDFLGTAIDQFNSNPKYSVIHFCTAIELLLKARLMHEHWSLIVLGDPDVKKFEAGDFKSLNFKDLIPRIEDVLDEKIPEKAKSSFHSVAQHRNRMVHFFHEAEGKNYPKDVIDNIVREQSQAWFFLRGLLESWGDVFDKYKSNIQNLNYKMKSHEVHLDTVFENIEPEIKADIKNGATYKKCSACFRDASKEHKLTDFLVECKCKVCLAMGLVLKVACPQCDGDIEITEDWGGKKECSCGYGIQTDELIKTLDTEPITKHNLCDYTPINCADCQGYHSVIHHFEYLICTGCIQVFSKGSVCGWCHEGQVGGDLEDSYYGGCEFCEGLAGWHKDD